MSVNKKNTEILAQKFRADHGLSATEAVSMKSVVRLCNILTVYLPMSDNAYGMSLKSPQNDMFILVNSKNARGRQHFTIAHEIFHLFVLAGSLCHFVVMYQLVNTPTHLL